MKRILVMLFGIMFLCSIPLMANATSFKVIGTDPISWEDARIAALALPGDWHLATITSSLEQAAVDATITAFYGSSTPGDRNEFWIGGYRLTTDQNWGRWVTGEEWDYTNWWNGEPNSVGGDEEHLALDWRNASGAWKWNDEGSAPQQIRGYVVESVPEPATMLLLGLGLLGVAGIRRKFKV